MIETNIVKLDIGSAISLEDNDFQNYLINHSGKEIHSQINFYDHYNKEIRNLDFSKICKLEFNQLSNYGITLSFIRCRFSNFEILISNNGFGLNNLKFIDCKFEENKKLKINNQNTRRDLELVEFEKNDNPANICLELSEKIKKFKTINFNLFRSNINGSEFEILSKIDDKDIQKIQIIDTSFKSNGAKSKFINSNIEFINVFFENKISFENSHIELTNVQFDKGFDAKESIILTNPDIEELELTKRNIKITKSIANEVVNFENSTFIEKKNYYESDFTKKDNSYKSGFEFKSPLKIIKIQLEEFELKKIFSFKNINIISGKISLNKVYIKELTILKSDTCNIYNAEIEKVILEEDANINLSNVNISSLIEIKKNSSILFQGKNEIKKLQAINGFKSLEFVNCFIGDVVISGDITYKALFKNVKFINTPEIGDIKFKNCNVDFSNVKFEDINSSNAIAGFRALNKACRDANYHHGEIFFHGLTLEGIGKNLKYKSDFVEKLLSDAYEVFSDFGRSVNRPLVWLLILGFIFFGINYYEINKINNLKLSENSVINKSIVENNKNCEEQFQLVKIHAKIVFKNAVGPLQLALTKDFISDCESKFYNKNSNSIIYFLNFFHAVISSGIWFIWFFMIRARFKL